MDGSLSIRSHGFFDLPTRDLIEALSENAGAATVAGELKRLGISDPFIKGVE